jgi:signal transduction histidine kinase
MSVADEGEGIGREALPHLFEPFFTTKDVGEGTGLGLSVAWGIVQEHGGWIDVKSGRGHGSEFSILLPEAAA